MTITLNDTPYIPRGVRLHYDRVRGRWVLLAPERTINLDAIGHAILEEIDAESSVEQIVGVLAGKYQAPSAEIAKDVLEFLNGLRERRFLEIKA